MIWRILGIDPPAPASDSTRRDARRQDQIVREAIGRIKRQDLLDQFWANEIPIAPGAPRPRGARRRAGRQQRHVGRGRRPGARRRCGRPGIAFRLHGAPDAVGAGPAARGRCSTPTRCSASLAGDDAPRARGARPAKRPLTHALEGIKVLDLGNFLAGPFGPMLLGDLGATVYKLESPEGDQMRAVTQPFNGCQRGKLDIVVDLKTPEGARSRTASSARSTSSTTTCVPASPNGSGSTTRRPGSSTRRSSTATPRCGATTGRVPPGPGSTSSRSRRAGSSTSSAARATRPTGTGSACATRRARCSRRSRC